MTQILQQSLNYASIKECPHFDNDKVGAFKIIEFNTQTEAISQGIDGNHFIFVLNGRCTISYDDHNTERLSSTSFAFVPDKAEILFTVEAGTRIAFLRFRIPDTHCNAIYIEEYTQMTHLMKFRFKSLKLKPQIRTLLKQIMTYINDGAYCGRVDKIKQDELFFCLRNYYKKEEIANLFFPLFNRVDNFKEFILSNYNKVESIGELIQLSAMCRTYFYAKFKEEFHMSIKQWILLQKVEVVKFHLMQPNITLGEVVRLCDLPSIDYLHRLCKKHFNATPSQLMRYGKRKSKLKKIKMIKSENLPRYIENYTGW